MGNNSLSNTEKNLRSIAKRYENVKYSVGLAVLFLMNGASAFSNTNAVQESERQKEAAKDSQAEKTVVKEAKSEKKESSQKLKASWVNMQFGANDMYSNLFATPKTKVDKASVVKSEKTVLVASADNSTNLPMFAKLLTDIEETTENRTEVLTTIANKEATPTMEEIKASKQELRSSVGNLQDKIDTARRENQKEIDGLRLELVQLMEQGNQVVKSPWSSWQFGMNYFYEDWGGSYKGRGDKAKKYPFEGIFTRSNGNERYISTSSKQYSKLAMNDSITLASTNRRTNIKNVYGLVGVGTVQEPIVAFDVNAGIRPKQVSKGAITITDKNPIAITQPEAIVFNSPTINIVPPSPVSVTATVPTVSAPTVTPPGVNVPALPTALSFSPVTPSVTAPTSPTVSLFDPVRLNFVGTGYGQGASTQFDKDASGYYSVANNFAEYDTGGSTLQINVVAGKPSWSGATLTGINDSKTTQSLVNTHSDPNQIYSFFNDTQGRDVIHKGKYEMKRDDLAGKNSSMIFISLNPYSNGTTRTYDFQGTVDLIGHNNPASSQILIGIEHQFLGSGYSILKNSGTINLKSGNNIVGIQIDTEGGHSKGETINAGTINISSERSIGIDYGYYYPNAPHTDV